ncbi:hypothetical protein ACGFNU_38985 [Spirillospora sp. NPDC048911]|uniref:hypothetical protein n=1 Tax=Spirillospora sp. NPDC048911 TaxID=3364527 RepID=UPI00371C6283
MPQAVTVTGTRTTGHRPLAGYRDLFEVFIRPFARQGTRFYLGGAIGIDSLALLWLASEVEASLVVVVPALLADQPAEARQAIASTREVGRLEAVVELGGETRTDGYHARNEYMVDRSDFVIGFPRAGKITSGTIFTLDYAASQDKPRLTVPV